MVALQKFVNEYKLKLNEVEFWVPYPYASLTLEQRREHAGKDPVTPPFKGRGSPVEIGKYLKAELADTNERPATPEEYRRFMAGISLGVDCSGFAYYVLDEYLKANYNQRLQDHLYKAKAELLEIYDHPKLTSPTGLERATVESYPAWVNLATIQADWGNNPRYVVESTTFVNSGSTVATTISDLREADLIGMMGYDGIGHHLVVVAADTKSITYAHSGGRNGRKNHYGGVEYGEIKITDPKLPIEKQEWSDPLLLKVHKFKQGATRRLRALANSD